MRIIVCEKIDYDDKEANRPHFRLVEGERRAEISEEVNCGWVTKDNLRTLLKE